MELPKYQENDVVYFKESAAIGFLEAVVISSMTRRSGQWLYSVVYKVSQPSAPAQYGDMRSSIHGKELFYTEDELISVCEALDLAERNAERNLARIKAQRQSMCPEPTE